MELAAKAIHLNNICKGCLSRDRKLQIITDYEINKVYCSIIDDELQSPGSLVLCWECIAIIQRIRLFRLQVRRAQILLPELLVSTSNISSLSKLSIVTNNKEIHTHHLSEESQDDGVNLTYKCKTSLIGFNVTPAYIEADIYNKNKNFTPYEESASLGVTLTPSQLKSQSEISINTKTEKDGNTSFATNNRETDIHFIKIEDDAPLDDVEGYFIAEGFDHQEDIDDKNFTIELDSSHKEKTKVESKRSEEKHLDNDFNDSDEEPLRNKKFDKERKRKKKKENGKKGKSNKVSVGKREKPSGVVSNPRVERKLQQLNVAQGQLEMVVLSWEEVEEERQKALLSIVFTRHEYRCQDCIVGFNHKFKLDNHMKKHDASWGEMECSVCRVRCRDSHALCAHRRRHRVRWRCCLCGETWSRAAVAADHVAREHHAPPPTHTCSVCGHAETTLGKLRNHIKNHAERQKCELCDKTFRDRTSLRTHLFIHKGEKEYSCPRCDKKFLFKKAMEVHLVTHDASAHLYCYQCDMNFKNRMSYTQHMKYSLKHIDPAKLKHACALCDKKFAKARRLQEHHVAVHLKATPVLCALPGCDFACSSRPVLRTHIRMVHRNARAQRNHVCDACGKAYTTKKTLEGHLRSHTGERPFACPLCPSTFGYEAALYNHNKLVHLKAKQVARRTAASPAPRVAATLHIPPLV